MDPRLHSFLQQLVRSAHQSVLPEALEEKMIKDLEIQLNGKLNQLVIEQLSEEDQEQFLHSLQDNPTQPEVMKQLRDKIPNIDEQFKQALQKFEQDYLEWVSNASNK